jgi:dTMP kinase
MAGRSVVVLLGIDGSGKSTQARLLADWLTGQGLPASSFKNPGGRLRLDRVARRVGRRDAPDLLGRGYVPVEAAVRWLALGRALLLTRVSGRAVVMDRYSYCQYALMRARGNRGERWARAAYAVFPEPDVVCLLVLSAEVAHRRVELRGRDREDLDHLAAFDRAYRSLPEAPSFHLIDAGAAPEQVQRALRAAMAPILPPRR